MSENKKKQIRMFDHDFEVVVREIEFIPGKYVATVNYLGYPDHVGIDYGYTEQEAIDRTVKKVLASSSLESLKHLY